jgi:FlaA1/EpsC-like NDP-sugar epimerase
MMFNRPNIAFAHDVLMAAIAFTVSLFLRLGSDIAYYPQEELYLGTLTFTLVAAVVFRSMRLYRGIWRYASLNDLLNITRAASLVVLIFLVIMFTFTRLEDLPRSLPFINWFVLIALLGGPRFLYRMFKDRRLDQKTDRDAHLRVPILLVGAGDSAELFIRDVFRSDSNYRVVGLVANSPSRVGRDIHGVEVMGTVDQLPEIVAALNKKNENPQRLVLSAERLTSDQIDSILSVGEKLGLTVARLPSLSDFQSGVDVHTNIKPIDVEDLLGRPQAKLDTAAMERLIMGRRVLITGAGGSIGSELVRQVSDLAPSHMTLVENSEYGLFRIDLELGKRHPNLSRQALIADVRDARRIDDIMRGDSPDLVFHAAALKHVPLVEANVGEGIETNVFGTINVAEAARAYGAKTFVQISTDKAVNPTSVMGASKRLAEQYCQALDLQNESDADTSFVTVRFGNVLGSTGSVVELFRNQLREGGPLTVTHPDMTRYFMTIREAVELVLQASALGSDERRQGGKIYVLDMGEPVKIMDLARQMIRLAGLRPEKDIEITITGTRPGEKLFEEVLHGAEAPQPTARDGVLIADPRSTDLKSLKSQLNTLRDSGKSGYSAEIIPLLRALIPEYAPAAAGISPAEVAE